MANEYTYKVNIDWVNAQTSLKDLTSSLDRLSQKLDEFSTKTNRGMSRSASATRKTTDALKQQRDQLSEINQRILSLSKRYTDLSRKELRELKKLRSEREKMKKTIREETAAAESGAKRAAAAQRGFNNQISIGRQLMLRLKSVMLTVFGAYAIINGIRNTINTIKDFEVGVARLQAILGATEDQTDRLSTASIELAKHGIFNASEITEVQVQLAKFGFTLSEIEDSMDGIANLAMATGEDLEQAATLVSSVIRGMGLEASETARVVDVLGKSFTSSALDISKFRESAKYIAPLARQMGWSIEEVASVLGKLADAGISGSLAGTGLRTTFIELWNPASDLSEILGKGIKTFDEFIDALARTTEEGISVDKILAAVPKRAKTMFSVLLDGAEDIRDFSDEMKDAGGSIQEMADIQLDTLAYQMERFNSAWSSFVLSVQKDGGWLTDFFSGMASYLNESSYAIDPVGAELRRARLAVLDFKNELKGTGRETNLDAIRIKIDSVTRSLAEAKQEVLELRRDQTGGVGGAALAQQLKEAEAVVGGLEKQLEGLNDLLFSANVTRSVKTNITEIINRTKELEGEGKSALDAFTDSYKQTKDVLVDIRDSFAEGTQSRETYDAILAELKKFFNERRKLIIEEQELLDEINKKIIEDEIKNLRALYAIRQKLELERNENILQSELDREIGILEINLKYAKLNYELDLRSGKLTKDQARATKELLLEIERTYQREVLELRQKYAEEGFQDEIDAFEREAKLMKERGAEEAEIMRARIKMYVRLLKAKMALAEVGGITEEEAKAIREMGEAIEYMNAQLDNMGGDDDDTAKKVEKSTEKIASAYKKLASEIIDSIQTIVDAQVENTERLVDDLNTRIAETQRQLEIETELYAAGYANNVDIQQKELDDLREIREEAIRDREKAIRKQQALEAVAQAIDLAGAVANTINIYSEIPFVGLALAGATVLGFLGLFASAQNQAKSLTQYGEGGEIRGKSHADGGVVIEGEGGEFVINKMAYAKNKELINAINADKLPRLDHTAVYNIGGKKDGDVIVDNKVWHEIKDLLGKNLNKRSTEIHGNKKIVTSGIRKRNIRLN